jgi:hypothetical protein
LSAATSASWRDSAAFKFGHAFLVAGVVALAAEALGVAVGVLAPQLGQAALGLAQFGLQHAAAIVVALLLHAGVDAAVLAGPWRLAAHRRRRALGGAPRRLHHRHRRALDRLAALALGLLGADGVGVEHRRSGAFVDHGLGLGQQRQQQQGEGGLHELIVGKKKGQLALPFRLRSALADYSE